MAEVLRYEEALVRIVERARSRAPESEWCELAQATGRITAEPIVAAAELPAFDNSSMDGFVVNASETATDLRVARLLAAGDAPPEHAPALGDAFEIMTGAPTPPGDIGVVRVEETERHGDRVHLARAANRGEFVRRAGTDFKKGAPVLAAGQRLRAEHLMALAALSNYRVQVWKKPRIAIVSTGREVVDDLERPLAPGEIRNATQPFLQSGLAELGAEARVFPTVTDDAAALGRVLSAALDDKPDLLVTTGAVSMGKLDLLPGVLAALGMKTHFHKVAIRPGKPLLFGETERGTTVFGLPGNPVSTAVGLRFFLTPFLRAHYGEPPEKSFQLPLAADVETPEGLRCFYKAALEGGKVRALGGQPSYMISSLIEANAWVVLPETPAHFAAGTMVDVFRSERVTHG